MGKYSIRQSTVGRRDNPWQLCTYMWLTKILYFHSKNIQPEHNKPLLVPAGMDSMQTIGNIIFSTSSPTKLAQKNYSSGVLHLKVFMGMKQDIWVPTTTINIFSSSCNHLFLRNLLRNCVIFRFPTNCWWWFGKVNSKVNFFSNYGKMWGKASDLGWNFLT